MIRPAIHIALALFALILGSNQVRAANTGDMLMVRSEEPFPETMSLLQQTIKKQGYTLSRVQRVDVGLSAKGYATDKYRVVFFAKAEQMHSLSKQHPQLIPYLPLKISIYAEEENTILVSMNPLAFNGMFNIPELKPLFNQWHKDILAILTTVQNSD